MTTIDARPTPEATLTEALTGGHGVFLAAATPGAELVAAGWVETELVAEGVAGSFVHEGEMPEDGRFEPRPGPDSEPA